MARAELVLRWTGADGALVHRTPSDGAVELSLTGGRRLSVGRDPGLDVRLDGDSEVSRLHAELELIGGSLVLSDDGLSQNGSFVNGERVVGRRRLRHGDELRFGATVLAFRAPGEDAARRTSKARESTAPELSPTQRRVLLSLCAPFLDAGAFARPAANRAIADEVFLSVEAVKDHLRTLFGKFGVEELAHNEKRLRLVERALETGAVDSHELASRRDGAQL